MIRKTANNFFEDKNKLLLAFSPKHGKIIRKTPRITKRKITYEEIKNKAEILKYIKKQIEDLSLKNFNFLEKEKIIKFLLKLDYKDIKDFFKFLNELRKNLDNKIDIFVIDENLSSDIYVDIVFDNKEDFSYIDEIIYKAYDILNNINKEISFITIGESLNYE